jgi:hypothetical protein
MMIGTLWSSALEYGVGMGTDVVVVVLDGVMAKYGRGTAGVWGCWTWAWRLSGVE